MHKKIFNTILKKLEKGIQLPVYCNTLRSNREIFEILLQTAFLNIYVETTVEEMNCYKKQVCSADTVCKRIKTCGWNKILYDFKNINAQLFNDWVDKPKGNVYVALDYHDVPRYVRKKRDWKPRKKQCDDIDKIVHSKKQSGTHCFHRIISADIVEEEKFTLAFEPVIPDSSIQDNILNVIRDARKKIHFKAVLMDRGFFNAPTVVSLQDEGIPYVIRAVKTKRINKLLEDFIDDNRGWRVYDYEFNTTAHSSNKKPRIKVKTKLVIVDSSVIEGISTEKFKDDDRYFIFITNAPVVSQDVAFQLAKDYRKRWRIETGYKIKKQFRGKTCSLSYAIRLFFILLSFVLYNLWIVINSKLKHRIWGVHLKYVHLTASLMSFFCLLHAFFKRVFVQR